MKELHEMSVREYDEHCEQIMSQFLDKYFYNAINPTSFERVQDKERQVKGIDVVMEINDKTYSIDEKAAIRYTNGLKTFALELSFLNRKGILQEGWLTDERKINDYFVFVWINKIEDTLIKNISSLKDIDVALVSKNKIMEHLESIGWTKDNLKTKDNKIRNENDKKFGNINTNGCKFSYSDRLFEKPINILLPKETYINIAEIYKNIKN
jgi:hypothetical protein